jgi:hypothetical protein
VAPPSAHAATIIVPDDNPSLVDAVAAAAPGDTVQVRPGTYEEGSAIEIARLLASPDAPQHALDLAAEGEPPDGPPDRRDAGELLDTSISRSRAGASRPWAHGASLRLEDRGVEGGAINARFNGEPTPLQQDAVELCAEVLGLAGATTSTNDTAGDGSLRDGPPAAAFPTRHRQDVSVRGLQCWRRANVLASSPLARHPRCQERSRLACHR